MSFQNEYDLTLPNEKYSKYLMFSIEKIFSIRNGTSLTN